MSQDQDSKDTRAALRRLASDTRDQAAAARVTSRELARERTVLLAALEQGWREQAGIVGELHETRDALRRAVHAYSFALRQMSVPPERMLIEVKQLVRDTVRARAPHPQEIMDQVVSWSIDAYYEQAGP